MDTTAKSLEELVRELPPDMLAEVRDFVELLLAKRGRHAERVRAPETKLKLDWRGCLHDLREQYTAVELEHKAAEWWKD